MQILRCFARFFQIFFHPCFHSFHESILSPGLRFLGSYDVLVHCLRAYQFIDYHDIFLSLSVKPGIELLLQLERIGLPKPDDAVSSGLEVESVTSRSRVHQKNLNPASIPVYNVLLSFEFSGLILGQSLHEPVPVMPEGPAYEDRLSPGVLDEFLCGFNLQRVHLMNHSLFIVHCPIGKLEELSAALTAGISTESPS